MVLVGIYRPHPGAIKKFETSPDEISHKYFIAQQKLHGNIYILLGAINVESFIFTMQSDHFVPIITKQNGFVDPSLLDHVWLNNPTRYSSGVVLSAE